MCVRALLLPSVRDRLRQLPIDLGLEGLGVGEGVDLQLLSVGGEGGAPALSLSNSTRFSSTASHHA